MKVAIIVTHVGVPGTLATTSFMGALAGGLQSIGVGVRVIGLASTESEWQPQALGDVECATPWMTPASPRLRDRIAAALLGIPSDGDAETGGEDAEGSQWYRELVLERALAKFAGIDRNLTVLVEPRSDGYLRLACGIARRRGWKVVVCGFEALTDRLIDPATRDSYIARTCDCADGLWALTENLASFWRNKGVGAQRIFRCPTIIAPRAFVLGPPPRANRAVYMAKNIADPAYKEIDRLLAVCESVRRSIPEFNLAICGDVDEVVRKDIAEAVRAHGLDETLVCPPRVWLPQLSSQLTDADVLLLPLADDRFTTAGFPKKLGEYLATGRPVVVTGVGDIPKLLIDGEHAFVVGADDPDGFADAVIRALRDPELADHVGASGRALAQREFSAAVVAGRLSTYLRALPHARRERMDVSARWSRVAHIAKGAAGDRIRGPAAALGAWRRSAATRVGYTRSGHTRVVAVKMAVVDVLRALRLKPPPPGD